MSQKENQNQSQKGADTNRAQLREKLEREYKELAENIQSSSRQTEQKDARHRPDKK